MFKMILAAVVALSFSAFAQDHTQPAAGASGLGGGTVEIAAAAWLCVPPSPPRTVTAFEAKGTWASFKAR